LIANYAGKIWVGIINLAFIPLYIKFMGIEGYGLVGVYVTLQSFLVILDMGLSTTVNRELARYSVKPSNQQEMRDLVRTLEMIYWTTAGFIAILVLLLSSLVAHYWLSGETLPSNTIQRAIVTIGFTLAFQFPVGFYTGGLMGLQRQVLYNILNAAIWTIRCVGAFVVVRSSCTPVLDFFNWQLFMSILNVAIIAVALWRSLPPSPQAARFQRRLLNGVWRFAAGVSIISIAILCFNQLDKVILSKQLSLTMFGYYSLAWQIAGMLFLLYYPLYTVFFPIFSQKVLLGDIKGLKEAYHYNCQLMSVLVLPVTIVVVLFSRSILLAWTGNMTTAENTYMLVTILMPGAALGALLYPPFSVQQAYGYTKSVFYTVFTSLVALVPLILISVSRYGAVGAATVWASVNAVQVLLLIHFTHQQFLQGEQIRWYVKDVGRPLLATLAVVGIARWGITGPTSAPGTVVYLAGLLFLAILAAALVTPNTLVIMKRYFSSVAAYLQ
jgi:O-antigen/teichoic acid export membrane protein